MRQIYLERKFPRPQIRINRKCIYTYITSTITTIYEVLTEFQALGDTWYRRETSVLGVNSPMSTQTPSRPRDFGHGMRVPSGCIWNRVRRSGVKIGVVSVVTSWIFIPPFPADCAALWTSHHMYRVVVFFRPITRLLLTELYRYWM